MATWVKPPFPNAPDGNGLFTYMKGEKWPHEQGEIVDKIFHTLHGAFGLV